MKDEIKSFLIQIKGNDEWKEIYDYITNLQEELDISQTNEGTYRLEMLDITKILGLDEHTTFDEVKEYATYLQEEKEMYKKEKDALMNSLFITRNKYNNDKARYRRKAKNYKQRIDKAIEEIKKRSTKEVADLYINILQGKSDE